MINVDELYTSVRDYALKGKSGYMSNTEFNQRLAEAQLQLQRFYIDQYERQQRLSNSLLPFMETVQKPISSGTIDLPSDFQIRLTVHYLYSENVCGSEPTITKIAALPLKISEVDFHLGSPIRLPSLEKRRLYNVLFNDKIRVYPDDLNGAILLTYIRQPAAATRAVTLDTANDEENYSSGSSTQLEWNSSDFLNFVDILLYYKGLQIRDSEILQWLAGKSNLVKINVS